MVNHFYYLPVPCGTGTYYVPACSVEETMTCGREAEEAVADEACPAPAIVERMAAEQDARLGAGMTERAKFRMNKP